MPPEEIRFAEALSSFVVIVGGPLTIATVVAFLVWFHRVNRNLPSLGARGLQYGPGQSVASWFIPVLDLFRPYQIAVEVWKASDPDAGADSWRSSRPPVLLHLWWGLFIAINVIPCIALWAVVDVAGWEWLYLFDLSELSRAAIHYLEFQLYVAVLGSNIANVIGAGLAIQLVRGITGRQEEKYRRVYPAFYGAAVPAPQHPAAAPISQPSYSPVPFAPFSAMAPSPLAAGQSIRCPRCGNQTPGDSLFCATCGERVALPSAGSPLAPMPPPAFPSRNQRPPMGTPSSGPLRQTDQRSDGNEPGYRVIKLDD